MRASAPRRNCLARCAATSTKRKRLLIGAAGDCGSEAGAESIARASLSAIALSIRRPEPSDPRPPTSALLAHGDLLRLGFLALRDAYRQHAVLVRRADAIAVDR